MTRYNGCGCGGHNHGGCNPCTSHNEIQQAVNDALALEKENLEQYETNAAQSATDAAKEAAKAAESASAAAQSQTNAETAASTATQAASSVTNTAIVLEETAERIEQAQDLLEEQISAVQTKPVYFEVSTPTSSLVLPETETVFNVRSIYIASGRQAVGYGFTFDKDTRTVTLAEAITAEQIAETEEGYILVEVICDVFSSDDPTTFPIQLGSNIGAGLVGTTSEETLQYLLDRTQFVVESVASLSTLKGVTGRVVRTKAYSAGSGLGGGLYYYDSNQADVNNGVTVINGWVRIFGKTRYASDAGLVAGMTSTEATTRLNLLLATATDGVEFDLENIQINLSTHARLSNVNNVVIHDYLLKGDKASWSFVNNDRGMLVANNCNNLEVHSGEITGVRKSQPNAAMTSSITASGRIQDGDSGMEFKFCNDLNVHHNKVHGVKTWGILSTNGTRPHVWKNTVYDCARQSGISVCIGTSVDVEDVSVHDNRIYNIGLYGVEIEKWTKTARRLNVYANNISYCQYGINAVGLIRGLQAHDNNVNSCRYGIAGTTLNTSLGSELDSRNYFYDNQLTGNYAGIGSSNSFYVTYKENIVNGLRSDDYLIYDPYYTVEIVAGATSFYSLRNLTEGMVIKIGSTLCTVLSSVAVTDSAITEKIGLTTVYLIVVDQLPDGIEDYTPFMIQSLANPTYSYGYWPFYLPNTGDHLIDNVFENVRYGLYQTAATSSNNDCFARGTKFNNVTVPVAGATYGIEVFKSQLQNCSRYTDSTGKLTYNQLGLKPLNMISQPTAVTASGTKPTITFYNYGKDIAVRARLRINNVNWTTGVSSVNLAITLNGVIVGYVPVTALGSSIDTLVDFVNNGVLLTGANTMRIVDTTGSLSFDSWYVDLFVAD